MIQGAFKARIWRGIGWHRRMPLAFFGCFSVPLSCYIGGSSATSELEVKQPETCPKAESLRLSLAAAMARTPPADIVPRNQSVTTSEGLIFERFDLPVEAASVGDMLPQHEAPVLLVKRAAEGRSPVVIVLHSTGNDKDSPQFRGRLVQFAQRGYIAVGMDARYHGERGAPGGGQIAAYYKALESAWAGSGQRPFLYDTVHDLRRLVDHLVIRTDVDPQRIGITGVSLGGMHAWLAAASDTRLAAAAPIIGVQSFGWAVANDAWQSRVDSLGGTSRRPSVFIVAAEDLGRPVDADVVAAVWRRLIPGLMDDFDATKSLAAIAPRPLLIANGEDDPRCPAPGVLAAHEAAAQAYSAAGASDMLQLHLEAGVAHADTPGMWEAVFAFFDKHLQTG